MPSLSVVALARPYFYVMCGSRYDRCTVFTDSALRRTVELILVALGALVGAHAARGASAAGLAASPVRPVAGAPLCAPAKLSATFGGEGATQSLLGSIAVTNRGSGSPVGSPAARQIAMRGGPPRVLIARPDGHGRDVPGHALQRDGDAWSGRSAAAPGFSG